MADQMKPTPRSTILGLFSDVVNLPLQYMSAPERTQQSQGVAQFLYGTGIPQTLDRLSYGDSLFSGSGMTLRPREETINAAMTVAPFAPAVGRVIPKVVRATKDLPVGMSIKDVGNKSINVRLNEASNFLSAKSEFGEVGGTIRPPDKLSDVPYLQINYAEVEKASRGKGKGKELYQSLIDEAQARGLRVFSDSTVEKSAVNVYKSLGKSGYQLKDMTTGRLDDGAVYGSGATNPAFEISSAKSFQAPQQAALNLAQQRAALPVEQGGLGLPANNTAADRAKAMGFDIEAYRGTTGDIESSVIPSDFFGSNYFGKGINLTTSPKDASKYASTDVGINTDLVGKAELMSEKLGISYPEAKAQLTSGGGTVIPISANIDNPLVIGAQKIQAPESVIRYALKESGYSGDVDKLVKQFKDANTGFEQFELIKSKQATPFYQNLSSLMNKNGLMIDESLSPKSEGGMHYVASLPEQIRSRFAAFDPFRKDVATATAMGVALPDLLAQPVNRYELPQETTPMYTDPFGNTIGSSIR